MALPNCRDRPFLNGGYPGFHQAVPALVQSNSGGEVSFRSSAETAGQDGTVLVSYEPDAALQHSEKLLATCAGNQIIRHWPLSDNLLEN